MIYSAFARGDEALAITISELNGKFVKVAMTEEEMFRGILGDAEFERRRAISYQRDWKEEAPPTAPPAEVPQVEKMTVGRYIKLLDKAVNGGPIKP